ncbi:MAG: sugar ABC transporter permease [Anaerolineae bacterium]|nr:sugar ABC transporter permease [Anaerolineae bacterium]
MSPPAWKPPFPKDENTTSEVSETSEVYRRRWWARWRPDQQWEAYLFLLPSFVGFLIFVALPVIAALALSFVRWNLLTPPTFVGAANYAQLLTRDRIFQKAFWNTVYFTVTIVPLQLVFGLALAVALNRAIRGVTLYRLIYFMPVVTTIVAAALVFQWMFNRDFGLISAMIWRLAEVTGFPISPPDWLNSSAWAKPAVVILTLWKNTGFTMVIYLAGLQAVPQELYDAAKVDGANAWQRFRRITVPMISSTTFFLLVIQMIGAFQLFSEPYVMTRGGPAQATLTIVYYIYQNAFEFGRMGKASAMAWVLFTLVFAFTFIQTRLQRHWVHYEAGG